MTTQVIREKPITNTSSSFNQFWEDVKAIALPYWYPTKAGERAFSEVIRSWGMLFLLLILIITTVSATAFNSFVNRNLVSVIIQDRDYNKLVEILIIYAIGLAVVTFVGAFYKFVRKQIALDWYKWLNSQVLDKYFSDKAYYKLNFKSDIDNPDQRLAQEIEPVISNALTFSTTFLEKILEMTIFLIIVWSISQQIAISLLIYTIIGNIIATYINQGLNKINQETFIAKAEYNYSLTHVRNHAESIAFFRGEKQEQNIIERRFLNLFKSSISKIKWERNQEIFSRGYQSVIDIFPYAILGPLYLQNEIGYGQLVQSAIASYLFATALGDLIREFGTSGDFSSYVKRLSEFTDALQAVTKQPEDVTTIKTIEENYIAFEHITLKTPDNESVIVEDLSLSVQPGEGLLIVGPSGRGKSSLLRAIAGLWNVGTGRLVRPPLEEVLFLPQRPYIILGTLREQLLYPNTNRQMSDTQIKQVLQQVNLQKLLSRVDSFDTEVPWENILSLGEQQRLAFARLLVTHPHFTILDEATSALDLTNEGNLYRQLKETKTTFISVGHRESLFDYHHWVLELTQDSSWQLMTVQDYRHQKMAQNFTDSPHVTEDSLPNHEYQTQSIRLTQESTSEGLSHKEMSELTSYAIKTIRTKASKGETIAARDGFTYRYDKDPHVLKWIRV